jgi:hypothetical protein
MKTHGTGIVGVRSLCTYEECFAQNHECPFMCAVKYMDHLVHNMKCPFVIPQFANSQIPAVQKVLDEYDVRTLFDV